MSELSPADIRTCIFFPAPACCGPSGLLLWGSPGPSSSLMPQDLGKCWQSCLQSPHPSPAEVLSLFLPLKHCARRETSLRACGLTGTCSVIQPDRRLPVTVLQKDLELLQGWRCSFSSLWQLLARPPLVMIRWSPSAFRFLTCWWSWPGEVSTCHSWKRNEKERAPAFWAQEWWMEWPLSPSGLRSSGRAHAVSVRLGSQHLALCRIEGTFQEEVASWELPWGPRETC